jgi:hypothetical protein
VQFIICIFLTVHYVIFPKGKMLLWIPMQVWEDDIKINLNSQSYLTTDSQSASLSWCHDTIRARDQFFFSLKLFLDSFVFLILWGPLWREDGSIIYLCYLASPSQSRSDLSPNCWDSPIWKAMSPYLYPPGTGLPSYIPGHWVPFSSPLTTLGATVEVIEPAYHTGLICFGMWLSGMIVLIS